MKKFRFVILVAALIVLAAFSPAFQQFSQFNSINVRDNLRVQKTTDLNGATTVAGGLTVEDTGLTVTAGGATVTAGDLTLSAGVLTTEESDNTTTGAQTLVPTRTYYHFAPTAVTTVTISTTGVIEGDWLILHNLVSTSTVIVDTTATQGGGNITLGQDDIAAFIFGDSVWVEMFSPDNS